MRIGPCGVVVLNSAFHVPHSAFQRPPCLSSYRASFVNSYSSVRVRPGAPAQVQNAECRMRNSECGMRDAKNPSGGRFRHSALRTLRSALKDGGHDVTVAARPVTAPVPVQIRLVTPTSIPHSAFCTYKVPASWPKLRIKMRDERSRRLAFPTSGILLIEQSAPRHKDLKAGIWIRAVRRAIQN